MFKQLVEKSPSSLCKVRGILLQMEGFERFHYVGHQFDVIYAVELPTRRVLQSGRNTKIG